MSHSGCCPSPGHACSFMPAVGHDPSSRKRCAASLSEVAADECRPTPAKRHKPSTSPPTSPHRRRQTGPGFWERLSRVQLSRQALREFDQRTLHRKDRARAIPPPVSPLLDLSQDARLKRLQRFARRGGPVLTHLRGFASQPTIMSTSGSGGLKRSLGSSRSNTPRSSKTSPYSGQYQQALDDARVHMNNRVSKPANWQDIQERINKPRPSLSPSRFGDAEFEEFTDVCERAINEPKAMAQVMPIIAGTADKQHRSMIDVQFDQMAPFDPGLALAKPDVYYGAAPETIDRRVRHDLKDQIMPSHNSHYPAVPNFFLEGKSDKGRADVAKKQACHDGAIGARAMHSLQNYGNDETAIYDGNAYSFTSIFHNGTGTLQMYTSHPTTPRASGEQVEYHMTQMRSFAMTDTLDRFREGATAYRNARDLAGVQRESFIEQANQRAARMPAGTPSSTHLSSRTSLSVLPEGDSDTSVNELALSPARSKRSRHSTTSTQPRHRSTQRRQADSVVAPTASDPQEISATRETQTTDTSFHRSRSRRPTPSSTKPLTEATTYTARLKQRLGRMFERGEQLVFVADEEWQATTMSGRAALFSDKYNVYYFTD